MCSCCRVIYGESLQPMFSVYGHRNRPRGQLHNDGCPPNILASDVIQSIDMAGDAQLPPPPLLLTVGCMTTLRATDRSPVETPARPQHLRSLRWQRRQYCFGRQTYTHILTSSQSSGEKMIYCPELWRRFGYITPGFGNDARCLKISVT